MPTREQQIEAMLTDLRICGRHVLRQPQKGAIRYKLRIALEKVDAFYRQERETRKAETRPSVADHEGHQTRLPYKDN